MSKRIDLPSEQDVRRVMTEHIEDAASAGGRATVIGLARRLGLRFPPDGGHRDSGTMGSAGRMSSCPANAGRSRPSTRSRPPGG